MTSDYVRPALDARTFHDELGRPIAYGSRYWGEHGEPPESAYGVCAHPERFEPVAQVARALVENLQRAYVVTRTDRVVDDRAEVRLVPGDGGAPMRLTIGQGVLVRAGWRYEGRWPDCGCDACDDDVLDLVDDLEQVVLAIADGDLCEWRSGPDPARPLVVDDAGNAVGNEVVPWTVHARLARLDREEGGWSSDDPPPDELLDEPFTWPAWPGQA